MFHGTFEHAIDKKGRVNVPVEFRDALRASGDERLFITNFTFQNLRWLDVYPAAAWLQFQARLREKPQFDPKVILFQTYYVGGAHLCPMDKQGRVLLPPRLRNHAGLKKVVVFAGASDKFRIWEHEAWSSVFSSGEQLLIDDPNMLSEMGI